MTNPEEIIEATFEEAFTEMKGVVLSKAAGDRAVSGVVGPYWTIFGFTEEPPRIVQVQPIKYERGSPPGLTATVTSIGIGEEGTPIVEVGRYVRQLADDPRIIFDRALDRDQTHPVLLGVDHAPQIFDIVYANVRKFDHQAPLSAES